MSLDITSGHKGTVDKIRFFLPRTTLASDYKGGKFQGSVDGTTFTDLFTLTEIPMEGWNNFFTETANLNVFYKKVKYIPNPTYNSMCSFMEIEVVGRIGLETDTDPHTCSGEIKRGS